MVEVLFISVSKIRAIFYWCVCVLACEQPLTLGITFQIWTKSFDVCV